MRFIGYISLALMLYFTYQTVAHRNERSFSDDEIESVLREVRGNSDKGRELGQSFERVLPNMGGNRRTFKAEVRPQQNSMGNTEVVVINQPTPPAPPEDVIRTIEGLRQDPDQEGLNFVRAQLFQTNYSITDKAQMFDAATKSLSARDLDVLSETVLRESSEYQLYHKALVLKMKGYSRPQAESYIARLWPFSNERQRELLKSFAVHNRLQVPE